MEKNKYIECIGRRKTAVARVRMTVAAKTTVKVNDVTPEEYFAVKELANKVVAPLTESKTVEKFTITAVVSGGGINGQAEAVRHGISRCLNEFDATLRAPLKSAGYLKRDPRAKERRKFGLKKARKSPQWSKR